MHDERIRIGLGSRTAPGGELEDAEGQAGPTEALLALQRSIGNQAVVAVLARGRRTRKPGAGISSSDISSGSDDSSDSSDEEFAPSRDESESSAMEWTADDSEDELEAEEEVELHAEAGQPFIPESAAQTSVSSSAPRAFGPGMSTHLAISTQAPGSDVPQILGESRSGKRRGRLLHAEQAIAEAGFWAQATNALLDAIRQGRPGRYGIELWLNRSPCHRICTPFLVGLLDAFWDEVAGVLGVDVDEVRARLEELGIQPVFAIYARNKYRGALEEDVDALFEAGWFVGPELGGHTPQWYRLVAEAQEAAGAHPRSEFPAPDYPEGSTRSGTVRQRFDPDAPSVARPLPSVPEGEEEEKEDEEEEERPRKRRRRGSG